MGDERAVSDVLSFVFVFALITSSVAVVSVLGVGGLQDARDAERIDNAERAFDVLADNMEDIAQRGAPSRATEVKLAGASLTAGRTTDVEVNVSDTPQTYPEEFRPISFGIDGSPTTVVYEGGAIIRSERDSSVMLREPNYLFSEDRTVIHYISPQSSEVRSVGGSTTVLVRAELAVSKSLVVRTVASSESINLTVETDPVRAQAWNRYLESEIDWTSDPCSVSGGTVSCTFQSDELYLGTTRARIELLT